MSRRGNFYGVGRGVGKRKKFVARTSPQRERDELADIDLAAKKWAAIAPALGFCGSCGAIVDEVNGKLHDEGCIPSQPERCRVGQRS